MTPAPYVVAIVGPTATGKTLLSIELAKQIDGEIISADSRQVYKGLDVGTGKVTKKEMQGVPHHLIDVVDPTKQFTVADYVKRGQKAITDIIKRGKVPIVIGGTGMYMDTLLGRLAMHPTKPNPKLRKKLERMTLEELQKMLKKLSPSRYKTIDQKNPRRLMRAIEIASAPTKGKKPTVVKFPYKIIWMGLSVPRPELKTRIIERLHERIDNGMLKEAKRLHKQGVSWERMEALGLEYRYMARFLQKKITHDEMVTQLESEIYKYAKRQMTWFKTNSEVRWYDANHRAQALDASWD
jgi:tRNA dimethylallyltransferase